MLEKVLGQGRYGLDSALNAVRPGSSTAKSCMQEAKRQDPYLPVVIERRTPEPGPEHPLVQAFAGVTKRGAERDAATSPVPVQGDREVVDTNQAHACTPRLRLVASNGLSA